jgi:hypothetical protein
MSRASHPQLASATPPARSADGAPADGSQVVSRLLSSRAALAWGLLWAAVGAVALYYLAPNPWPMQHARVSEMKASLAVLDQGGPALLGYQPGTHRPYAIGYSDDQGVYVVVPLLSHWLGASDPLATFRWMWLMAWTSTLLFSAVVFRAIFRSSWAALLAPPTLLVCVFSFGFGDIYWVTAWIFVASMPLLILIARRPARRLWPALVPIALVAGVITTIRSNAGLAVALAAAAVAAVAPIKRPLRLAAVAAVAVAYFAPGVLLLPAIRAHRDDRVGIDLSANTPTSHPLWHSLYIGLGYTPNRYGIHYLDGYALAAAREVSPRAPYLSPAYASALHREVNALIDHDFWFVAKAEAQKASVELSHAARYLLLLALLLPSALAARGAARLRPFELALFLPALAIGALPAVVAVPSRDYELTLLAPLGVLGLLAIGSAAARAQRQWPAWRAAVLGWATRAQLLLLGQPGSGSRQATLRVLLVAVVLLAPTFLFARHLEAEHERWDRRERNPPTVVLAGAASRSQGRVFQAAA